MGWVLAFLALAIGLALVVIAATGSQSKVWAAVTGSPTAGRFGIGGTSGVPSGAAPTMTPTTPLGGGGGVKAQ